MKSNKKLFVIACIVGVLAFLGNSAYWGSRLDDAREKELVKVVRAKAGIKPGTPLTAKLIEQKTVPKRYAPRAAVEWANHQNFLGSEVAVEILPGDYVLESHFSERGVVGRTLSQQLENENFRAITIPVDETNSFSRSIISGDKVDILFSFQTPMLKQKLSIVLLQNVPVISTGTYSAANQELGDKGGRGGRYNTVTLKVTTQDAFRLNYARQAGTLNFLLRSARDNVQVDMTPISGVQDILTGKDKETIELLIKNAAEKMNEGSGKVEEQIREQARAVLEQQRRQQGGAR